MISDKWLYPEEAEKDERLRYIRKMQSSIPAQCPECGSELITDEDHIYCSRCGLITMASISYVAGQRIDLPYGILLM